MTELRRRLIEIYAIGPIDTVHASDAYRDLCSRHEDDNAFNGERYRIERLRAAIDTWIGAKESYSEQVEFALRLIGQKLHKRAEREACRELILASFGRKWEPEPRRYFEEKSVILMDSLHYFLSFTNRNPGKPNLNVVNRNHQFFIIDALGQTAFDRADKAGRNLVAEAVNHLLRNCSLEGFYYPEHEGDSTDVATKLKSACDRSTAFVQLAQQEMFRFYDESANWCWKEFQLTSEADPDRVIFVKIDRIDGDDIVLEFEPWWDAFNRCDPVELAPTRWQDPGVIDSNVQLICPRLSGLIRKRLDRLFMGVPD